MPTSNEAIRDALIKRQIILIKQSGRLTRDVRKLLYDAHKDLAERIDERLKRVIDGGEGETQRLLRLERNIRDLIGKPHRAIEKMVEKDLTKVATEDPRQVTLEIKKSLPVVITFSIPDAHVLRQTVKSTPVDGKPVRMALKELEEASVSSALAAIRQGMSLGEGVRPIKARIRKALEISARRVEGIVRTATNAISNSARQLFFKKNKDVIENLVWVATLDSRTCPYCGALDGKRYKPDKGPRPPAHINCRCTMVGSIGGKLIGERPLKRSTETELLDEFTKENGLGKVKRRGSLPRGYKGKFDEFKRKRVRELTGRTAASVTFDEFLRGQSKQFQDDVLRKEVATWYRKKQVDLDDLFDQNGDIYSIEEILRRRPDLRGAT